jgi:hypothetical protein
MSISTSELTPPATGVLSPASSEIVPPMQSVACGLSVKEHGQKFQNLIGRRFGRLIVESLHSRGDRTRWNCLCDCGNIKIATTSNLNYGHVSSCGCYHRERIREVHFQDLTGQRFGRLVVTTFAGITNGVTYWTTLCDCGKTQNSQAWDLKSGHTTSCGCYHREMVGNLFRDPNITDEERVARRGACNGNDHWSKLSKQILARDDYTCLVCGERGGRLAAHHLESWSQCKELRYDPANIITLCKECHTTFHKMYTNDCTFEDFEEFLKQ